MTQPTSVPKSSQPSVPWWLAALGIVGALLIGNSTSTTTPPPSPTTTTTTSTTIPKPLQTTTTIKVDPAFRRWFADDASWNQLAQRLGRAPASRQEYAKRLYYYGGGTAPPGGFNTAFGDYSIPWYPVTDATTKVRIYQSVQMQKLYTTPTMPIGTEIPWNPNWRPGTGNDNLLMVIDEKTGDVWHIGGVGQLKVNCFDAFGPNGQAQYDVNNPNHLCTFGGAHYNLYTASDKNHTTTDDRGMGINKAALIPRAAEVKQGAIKHALEITITGTMFGQPACVPAGDPSAAGFGTSCGGYVAPATKLERTNPDVGCAKQVVSDGERSKTIPEGTRFAVAISDAGIESWLDGRGYSGQLRSTARIFAVALRDYGFIVAETGCYGMHFETDSANFGAAAPIWASLGVAADGSTYPRGDLVAGLITPDNLYVVNTAEFAWAG